MKTWPDHEPKTVTEQSGGATEGGRLPKLSAADWANSPMVWSYANGMVTLKDSDRFAPVKSPLNIDHFNPQRIFAASGRYHPDSGTVGFAQTFRLLT
ncbi:MAG: hypothetical protein WBS33_11350 [Verrucomicrobiia bacterium]